MSDAWIGVVGTLLGGILGFGGSFLIERSKRRYEAAHRFEDERRAVYIRFIEAADEIEKTIREREIGLALRREMPERDLSVPPRPDFTKFTLAKAEIELLSRRQVDMSALILSFRLGALDDAAREDEGLSHDERTVRWQSASSEVYDSREQFLRAARRDLDLPTGVMSRRQERIWRLKQRLRLAPRSTPKPPEPTP